MHLRATTIGTAAVALSMATTATAQVTFRNTGIELRDAVRDIGHIWLSPFRAEQRDWIAAIGVAAGAVMLVPVDDQIDSWIVRHPSTAFHDFARPFDETNPELGDLSTGKRLLPISAALIASGMVSDNRKLREAGWGCLSAWQASGTIRMVTYAAIARDRPSVENADQYDIDYPGGEWEQHSFFGGHAANAVACATFWNSRFKLGILEPILYAGAAGISVSRMTDRRHWASDTWVGVAAGYAMGRSIAARYARREARRERAKETEPVRMSILDGLNVGPAPGGLAFQWSGKFGGRRD